MSGNTEKCDDADWKTPRPSCTCGAGDDAPWSAHLSKRFGYGDYAYSSDQISDLTGERRRASLAALQLQVGQCPVYTWHKGCHDRTPDDKPNATRVRACPHQGCKVKLCVCDNHGGDAEAIRRMVRHLDDHIVCAPAQEKSFCDGYPDCPGKGRGVADLHIHTGEKTT